MRLERERDIDFAPHLVYTICVNYLDFVVFSFYLVYTIFVDYLNFV